MKSRDGEVRATVVPSVGMVDLHKEFHANIAQGATLYADKWVAYRGLKAHFNHATVGHGAKEYVVGDCHTNGIESFWALFKRAYHGIYHQMSKKHLQKYVDEWGFRLNLKSQEMGFPEIFEQTVMRSADGQQLPYKELIA